MSIVVILTVQLVNGEERRTGVDRAATAELSAWLRAIRSPD